VLVGRARQCIVGAAVSRSADLDDMHKMPSQNDFFGKYGKPLSATEAAHFSDEQRKQMALLQKQTERLFENLGDVDEPKKPSS
jgi:hypothetical protein